MQMPDLISELLDVVLSFIISMLPIDEALRSFILFKRWRALWWHSLRIEFQWRRMIKPSSQLQNPEASCSFVFNLLLRPYTGRDYLESPKEAKIFSIC
ncbi:hypothetical protein L6164_018239 [Bauhinia variegata]|uniref:Uncharacterized protein n=1 Tax=Bauhinia variegata TaxID=167791 RepID=A0ACB9NAL2_BAUVA|nr:hypothetical protein L6164_018239 [Bauhinia variegata]